LPPDLRIGQPLVADFCRQPTVSKVVKKAEYRYSEAMMRQDTESLQNVREAGPAGTKRLSPRLVSTFSLLIPSL
jgi:hypothetical protein